MGLDESDKTGEKETLGQRLDSLLHENHEDERIQAVKAKARLGCTQIIEEAELGVYLLDQTTDVSSAEYLPTLLRFAGARSIPRQKILEALAEKGLEVPVRINDLKKFSGDLVQVLRSVQQFVAGHTHLYLHCNNGEDAERGTPTRKTVSVMLSATPWSKPTQNTTGLTQEELESYLLDSTSDVSSERYLQALLEYVSGKNIPRKRMLKAMVEAGLESPISIKDLEKVSGRNCLQQLRALQRFVENNSKLQLHYYDKEDVKNRTPSKKTVSVMLSATPLNRFETDITQDDETLKKLLLEVPTEKLRAALEEVLDMQTKDK